MARKLSAIRTVIRQVLSDEFAEGVDLEWENDELDIHIQQCIEEISDALPYEVKETLTTTAGSRDIDISSITDLLDVDKVEYKIDQYPQEFRNCSVFADVLTMKVDAAPGAGETVYAYCYKIHTLTETASTLKPKLERLLILGATATAAISKARSLINTLNLGGSRTPADMSAWGTARLALFREGLRKATKIRPYTDWPKG